MLTIILRNFKTDEKIEFDCIQYEVEKGMYKFYLTKSRVKYIASYDWVLDVIYPFELNIETK